MADIFAIRPSTSRGVFRKAASPLFPMGCGTSGTLLKCQVSKHIVLSLYLIYLTMLRLDLLKTMQVFAR